MVDFEVLDEMGHEQVVFCHDANVGLRAIIAIHNTTLGPALGGCRMWTYESQDAAVIDALRLSQGMTYKAAVSGLNLGGGKTVVMGDPAKDKSEGLFRSLGRFIESLNGRYITAEDVGTDVNDMEYVFNETSHVVGVAKVHGGSGDPSPFTAYGCYRGIEACVERRLPSRKLGQLTIALQGMGHVGIHLAKSLADAGCALYITDIRDEPCQEFAAKHKNVTVVRPDEIYGVRCDIFCPCALGAVINPQTVEQLKCSIVAGAANNQLETTEMASVLRKRNILYATDYAINAGGLMNVSIEFEGYLPDRAKRMVTRIYDILHSIFDIAERESISTARAADLMAERRIETVGKLQRSFLKKSPGHPRFRMPADAGQSTSLDVL